MDIFEASLIMLFIFIVTILIFAFGIFVFLTIVNWKLYEKAGKPGWTAIIPIYNTVILLEIAGYKWYYIFLLCFNFIPIIGPILVILFSFSFQIKIAKSFGQSAAFGIGLFFLNPIFRTILVFDKKIKYVGPAVNGDIDFNDLF